MFCVFYVCEGERGIEINQGKKGGRGNWSFLRPTKIWKKISAKIPAR